MNKFLLILLSAFCFKANCFIVKNCTFESIVVFFETKEFRVPAKFSSAYVYDSDVKKDAECIEVKSGSEVDIKFNKEAETVWFVCQNAKNILSDFSGSNQAIGLRLNAYDWKNKKFIKTKHFEYLSEDKAFIKLDYRIVIGRGIKLHCNLSE